jgi:hypothetical protein
MSISKVRESYEVFSNSTKSFFGTEDELIDLITAIAEYILKNPNPSLQKESKIPEGYVSLDEFGSLYPLFCRATLFKCCSMDSMRNHAVKVQEGSIKKWQVDPQEMLKCLQKNTTGFHRRMELMSRLRNEVQ